MTLVLTGEYVVSWLGSQGSTQVPAVSGTRGDTSLCESGASTVREVLISPYRVRRRDLGVGTHQVPLLRHDRTCGKGGPSANDPPRWSRTIGLGTRWVVRGTRNLVPVLSISTGPVPLLGRRTREIIKVNKIKKHF